MRSLPAVIVSIIALAVASTAEAQFQAGAHYSALAMEYPDQTRSGVGAFAVYSPREWIGIDVGTSVLFDKEVGGTAWQLLAGPRVGTQVRGLSVYGRVRPGVVRFSERFFSPNVVCVLIYPPPESCLAPAANFALDVGGTVETGISPAAFLRFDLGDTLVRYRRGDDGTAWKHGLQFNAGVGWKF